MPLFKSLVLACIVSLSTLTSGAVVPTSPPTSAVCPSDGHGQVFDLGAEYSRGNTHLGAHTEESSISFRLLPYKPQPGADVVVNWNHVAIDASGLDHTPPPAAPLPGSDRKWKQQFGPTRSSRAIAMAHIAMFDAALSIQGQYATYCPGLVSGSAPGASVAAAISQAAHDTLTVLFTAQTAIFDSALAAALGKIPDSAAKTQGISVGAAAAACILANRSADHSSIPEPVVGKDYIASDQPGAWRPDPVSKNPTALGAFWGQVTPFALKSSSQFRSPPPPALNSHEYAVSYNRTKDYGGDGVVSKTKRTHDELMMGLYWAYDGTPTLCAPPRLYNQLVCQVGVEHALPALELLRLLTLSNLAMAEAGIASWETKYHYATWRPITAVRESDPGTGPSGLGDGNNETVGDVNWLPVGAPAGKLGVVNQTPPFPTYPSGHATFGGALFQVMRRYFGTDNVPFTFVSDELNGATVGYVADSVEVRPMYPRSFQTLSQAEEENGESRIYLGIHFDFDKYAGSDMGKSVANWVVDHVFSSSH